MTEIEIALQESARHHNHLCPKQVLGVRMGCLAGRLLGLDLPQHDKRMLVIMETDGCAADGVAAATGCTVGHRTLRIEDYGKVAATFVDCASGRAIRVVPRVEARVQAADFAAEAAGRWQQQLLGYQRMPDAQLLDWRSVELVTAVEDLVSKPRLLAHCSICGEEVINGRELHRDGNPVCRACAGAGYYRLAVSQDRQPAALR